MVPAMEQKFWQESWDTGRIGFNQGKPNELLVAHADKLGKPPKRTLVPLAGKAFDMRWLAERGHDVVGVEFVSEAIAAFFKDWGVTPTSHRLGAHEAQYAKGVILRASAALDVSATAQPIVNNRARLATGVLDGVFIEFSPNGLIEPIAHRSAAHRAPTIASHECKLHWPGRLAPG